MRKLIKKMLVNPYIGWLMPLKLSERMSWWIALCQLSRWMRKEKIQSNFSDRYKLYEHLCQKLELEAPVLFWEFGVFKGVSLKWWLQKIQHPEARFVGFDSFVGLPQDWGG